MLEAGHFGVRLGSANIAFYPFRVSPMIVRPRQHWLRLIFVWHGSVLHQLLFRLLLNFAMAVLAVRLAAVFLLAMSAPVRPPSLDPVAAARWAARPNRAGEQAASPWLHEEVASRMQERLDFITLEPDQWVHWEPLR